MCTLRELINKRNIPNSVKIAIYNSFNHIEYCGTVGNVPKIFEDMELEKATYSRKTKEITVRECA